jgi:transposase
MPRGQSGTPTSTTQEDSLMKIVIDRCAGLDVHKDSIVACVRCIEADGALAEETRNYGTTTAALLALLDWLTARGVGRAAMESTGVYWKPVFHILEGHLEVMLVNAQHIKNVPGRKTDVKDAQWIAELLQYGLLAPSFVPPADIRELRDLTRQRTVLVREKATVANRIQKVLEDANIKLGSVASDPLGVSGRAILRGLIEGERDPATLAERARARLRKKIPALREALRGRVTEHHRFLLKMLLDQIGYLEGQIAQFDARIAQAMVPLDRVARRLETIPGISGRAAEVIVAEIGTDMGRFPGAGNLASWAGLCPGNHESAGKRQSGRTTKGNRWLRAMLVQVAWAAVHAKGTIFQARYRGWIKRMGKKKALVAVAHKIVVLIHRLLRTEADYQERYVAEVAA